jgi:hypothetical protein
MQTNFPSRTAVDWNGDVWVANRAFGGQSSVSKIANDASDCTERNGAPGIQTSSDVNGDGVIDTDCNDDGVPDDIANVASKPCTNGKAQEFYGLDDECVLFTTNTDASNQWGRPLTLSEGSVDFGPSDAWAGLWQNGHFFRIDGSTGLTKAMAPGPAHCYGATADRNGILWIAIISDGRLGYFDTTAPANVGLTRPATFGLDAYGIALDRDQNIWQGGWGNQNAYRYTPNRAGGFAGLGQGGWTAINNPGNSAGANGNSRGVAADSRTMNSYFVWLARDGCANGCNPNGWIVRIPASSIGVPMGGHDISIDGSAYPALKMDGTDTIGVGVDVAQNVWGISHDGSVATRIPVDAMGKPTQPDITSGAAAGTHCPAGDRCPLGFKNDTGLDPYTYSDFTGFGLRNFTNPRGSYSYVQQGCVAGDTKWVKLVWDADVPQNTSLSAKVRTGKTPVPDGSWGAWSMNFTMSPASLAGIMPSPAEYIQVEFDFTTMDKSATAKLKTFSVYFECSNVPG